MMKFDARNWLSAIKTHRWSPLELLCALVIVICLIFGCLHFCRQDIYYDTDIARDFLLWQDMVDAHKISLIGGRSSLPGVFHGPLYYWLVLPFFVLGGGNPIVVAIFWLVAYWLFLWAFYWCTRKMFDRHIALIATALLSTLTCFYPAGYTHTVLANFLIIPLVYFVGQYCQHHKITDLIIAVLLCGITIQFQLAFGVPMTLIFGLACLCQIIMHKNWRHLLSIFAILLPLSTYLAFDVRHDWMQTRAVLGSFGTGDKVSLDGLFDNHRQAFFDSLRLSLFLGETWRFILVIALIIFTFICFEKYWRHQKWDQELFSYRSLLLLTFVGFWVIVLNYHGHIWPQYYRTLLPVAVLLVTYLIADNLSSRWQAGILGLLIVTNLWVDTRQALNYWYSEPTSDEIHWKFYRQMMTDITTDAEGREFGYFIYSPDQFGYQGKYAARYFTKDAGDQVTSFAKKPLTYLLFAPNMSNNPWADEWYWQEAEVKIDREADHEWTYSHDDAPSYTVKRFDLTVSEATVSANPYLLDGIQFR